MTGNGSCPVPLRHRARTRKAPPEGRKNVPLQRPFSIEEKCSRHSIRSEFRGVKSLPRARIVRSAPRVSARKRLYTRRTVIALLHRCSQSGRPALHGIACIACIALQPCNDATRTARLDGGQRRLAPGAATSGSSPPLRRRCRRADARRSPWDFFTTEGGGFQAVGGVLLEAGRVANLRCIAYPTCPPERIAGRDTGSRGQANDRNDPHPDSLQFIRRGGTFRARRRPRCAGRRPSCGSGHLSGVVVAGEQAGEQPGLSGRFKLALDDGLGPMEAAVPARGQALDRSMGIELPAGVADGFDVPPARFRRVSQHAPQRTHRRARTQDLQPSLTVTQRVMRVEEVRPEKRQVSQQPQAAFQREYGGDARSEADRVAHAAEVVQHLRRACSRFATPPAAQPLPDTRNPSASAGAAVERHAAAVEHAARQGLNRRPRWNFRNAAEREPPAHPRSPRDGWTARGREPASPVVAGGAPRRGVRAWRGGRASRGPRPRSFRATTSGRGVNSGAGWSAALRCRVQPRRGRFQGGAAESAPSAALSFRGGARAGQARSRWSWRAWARRRRFRRPSTPFSVRSDFAAIACLPSVRIERHTRTAGDGIPCRQEKHLAG